MTPPGQGWGLQQNLLWFKLNRGKLRTLFAAQRVQLNLFLIKWIKPKEVSWKLQSQFMTYFDSCFAQDLSFSRSRLYKLNQIYKNNQLHENYANYEQIDDADEFTPTV